MSLITQTQVHTYLAAGRQVFHGPFQKKRMRNVTGYPYLVGALNNADSEEMHSKRKYKKMKNTLTHTERYGKCKGKHAADSGERERGREIGREGAGSSERASCRRFNDFLAALFGLLSSLWATFLGADLFPPAPSPPPPLDTLLNVYFFLICCCCTRWHGKFVTTLAKGCCTAWETREIRVAAILA